MCNLFRTKHRSLRVAAGLVVFVLACASCLGGGGGPSGSIGAVLVRDNVTGAVRVQETPDDHAASEAGLDIGDQIKMIDGILVDDLDPDRLRALLRGKVGSKVTLTVVRGEEVLDIELAREKLGGGGVKEREERVE